MKTIFSLLELKNKIKDSAVALGVFDGLHQGHKHLLKSAVAVARRQKIKSVCVTFHPHPKNLPYLISLNHRLRLIEELGLDYCAVIRFSKSFARILPKNFIQDILVKYFHPRFVFVGNKFRFGYKAGADINFLKLSGEKFGFKVCPVKELKIGKHTISSTIIRSLIRKGDLKNAQRFLGRRVSVLGTVISGHKRGRILGAPTANINPHHEVLPSEGVYAVRIAYQGKVYGGLCNIGRRPTFSKADIDDNRTIEAHLFDFKKEIYGEDLEIQFIRRLRSERKFSSQAAFISQLSKDRALALKIIENKER